MMQWRMFFLLTVIVTFLVSGCGKEKEKTTTSQSQSSSTFSKEVPIASPEVIKGKWKSIKLTVYDKKIAKENTYVIDIGSTFPVPESDFSIKVDNFFPHFILDNGTITSKTNDLKNPAAQISVYQGSKLITKGWVYSKYPTSTFQGLRFVFALVG